MNGVLKSEGKLQEEKMTRKFILQRDDDAHWYVIPADKQEEWAEWLESEDAEDGILPDFAEEIGGHPSLVEFENYRIV